MADTKIQVIDNGPLIVSGSFEVQDGAGNTFTLEKADRAALCRCGQSGEKPFCDGTHRTCGFKSEPKAQ